MQRKLGFLPLHFSQQSLGIVSLFMWVRIIVPCIATAVFAKNFQNGNRNESGRNLCARLYNYGLSATSFAAIVIPGLHGLLWLVWLYFCILYLNRKHQQKPLKNVDLFSQNVTEKDESSTKYFQFSAWQIKTDCFFMPIGSDIPSFILRKPLFYLRKLLHTVHAFFSMFSSCFVSHAIVSIPE